MAQNIVITYNSFVIGSSNSTIREGTYRETHSYRKYSLDCDILVTGTDDSNFVTNLQAVENALKADNKKLEIKFGSTVHRTFDPSASVYTGLNIRTNLSKSGQDFDTDRSRIYSFSVSVDLPANSSDDNFRREASWDLSFDTSDRMRLTFSGVYTAGGGTPLPAAGQYLAQIETWITSVFTALNSIFTGITQADFELISETATALDDDYMTMRFNRVYQQVLFPDSGSGTNHASIKNAQVSFNRSYSNRFGTNNESPVRVNISYSCNVRSEQVTYSGLTTLYTGTIKPWIIAQAKTAWNGDLSLVEQGSEDLNVSGNTIRASLTVLILAGNQDKLKEDLRFSISYNERKTYIDLWNGLDFSYSVFSPGIDITGTSSADVEILVNKLSAGVPSVSEPPPPVASNQMGIWDKVSKTVNQSKEFIGNDRDDQTNIGQTIFKYNITQTFKWIRGPQVVSFPGLAERRTIELSNPKKLGL